MPSPALQEIKLRVENLDEELSLLRSALEIVPEPVLVLNREKAFIKTLGKAEETLGYSWKELQKMVFIDLVDLEEAQMKATNLKELTALLGEGAEHR